MPKYIGIDLGTSNTKICTRSSEVLLREASAVVFDTYTGETISAGTGAKKLIGRNPPEKDVVTPIKRGVICNYDDACSMLDAFLNHLKLRGVMSSPKCAVSIPWGITEVEKNAFENVCLEAGCREVNPLIEEPMAAAIGAGIDILNPGAKMICDIGGGNIQAAVISYKGIINAKMARVGGDDLDDAIIAYVKDTYNVLIGKQSAEFLKKTAGSAHPEFDRASVEIRGRNLLTGQAATLSIRSGELREAMSDTIIKFAELIRSATEKTDTEILSDIFDEGLVICGGSALIPGLDKQLSNMLGIKVKRAKQPIDCVINGISKIMDMRGELTEVVSIKD